MVSILPTGVLLALTWQFWWRSDLLEELNVSAVLSLETRTRNRTLGPDMETPGWSFAPVWKQLMTVLPIWHVMKREPANVLEQAIELIVKARLVETHLL